MGCSLAARLVALKKEIKRNHHPDFLFIEPSEMVVTREIRSVMAMARRDIVYEIGPIITLINGPAFEFLWEERSPLLIGQMNDADMVALSRADLMSEDRIREIENVLKDYTRSPFPVSVPFNVGIHEIMTAVQGNP